MSNEIELKQCPLCTSDLMEMDSSYQCTNINCSWAKSFTARPDGGDGYTVADERARCLLLVTRARATRNATLKAMVHLSKEIGALQSQLAAERTRREEAELAMQKLDAAMNMQEKRETQEFHIPQHTMRDIWDTARGLVTDYRLKYLAQDSANTSENDAG